MKIMDDKSIRSALVTTPQPAAGWDVRLEARPADGGDWTEIFPAQLNWVVKQGHEVRATEVRREAPAPAEGLDELENAGKVLRDVRNELDRTRAECASWKQQFESASAAASEYSEFWEKHSADFDQFGNYIPHSQIDGDLRAAKVEIERLKATRSDSTEAQIQSAVRVWLECPAGKRPSAQALGIRVSEIAGNIKPVYITCAVCEKEARSDCEHSYCGFRGKPIEPIGYIALSPPSGGDEAKESDKTGMRVEDKPRSHGESLQYGPDTSSSSSTAATPHGKGSDAASVAIPVASSDLLVSQEAPVLSEPSPPADRREIVAWFKDRIDKYATQLNATGQADVAHLLRRDAQIILAALDGGRDA